MFPLGHSPGRTEEGSPRWKRNVRQQRTQRPAPIAGSCSRDAKVCFILRARRRARWSTGERVSEEDQAQHSLAEAVSLRLNGYEYLQLRQIQEALDRLQLGEFGMCLSCDQPIAPKRLRAVPWAKYCVKCQEMIADQPSDGHDPLDD